MQAEFVGSVQPLNEHDREQLAELIDELELSNRGRTVVMFAIAPESRPEHPVVEQLVSQLGSLDEQFQVYPPFRYGENTLYDFLQTLDDRATLPLGSGRRVIMAFGLEQLKLADFPRFVREMKQLNLGREEIFKRNLVLIFWLNREDFLDEFRNRTPDFWDWRGNVATFTTRPPLNQLLYPYLEWLIAENSYLKMSGVMQVNRQVDIFLDQIYVSLQAEWVEERSQSFRERITTGEGQVRSSRASLHKLGEPD
ncbi:MAG: histidine kinase, partial [Coleofasciculus sp. Co-bin14]|nr:histidine kinase [Coleofasciculus sp. Co-bin14]